MEDRQAAHEAFHGEYAGFVSRAVAFLIDRLAVIAALSMLSLVVGLVRQPFRIGRWLGIGPLDQGTLATVAAVLAIVFELVYCVGFWSLTGRTPGKQVMGLLIVRTDGQRMRMGAALLRWFGYYLSAILLVGYLWVLADDRRQAFHDKLAGTVVVYLRPKEVGFTPPTPIRVDRSERADERHARDQAENPAVERGATSRRGRKRDRPPRG